MIEHESHVAGVTVVQNDPQASNASWQMIYAPGAGSSIRDPFGTFACDRLAELGVPAARFQFPYQEAGTRRPDRAPVLEATWLAVIGAVSREGLKLVISGRSMGGRFGTIVASKGAPADGVVAFAYPLHAPGRPENPRAEHLPAITVPALFCSGTRDAFGTPEELQEVAALVPNSRLHVLDGADHGFAVLKRSGRTRDEVFAEAVTAMLAWVSERVDA
jgi:predicted alpha/beta-hydrolase family hydrolase